MTYYCGECGRPCVAHQEDFGIGPVEAHGRPFVHTALQYVSDCHDAPLFDDPELTRPSDPSAGEDDWLYDQERER